MFLNNNSKKNNTYNNNKQLKNDLENEIDNTIDRYNVVQLKLKYKKLAIGSIDGYSKPGLVLFRQEIEALENESLELMQKIELQKKQLTQVPIENSGKSLYLKSKWALFKSHLGINTNIFFGENSNSVGGLVAQHLLMNKQTTDLKNLAQTNKFWNKEVTTVLEPSKQARLATLEKYKNTKQITESEIKGFNLVKPHLLEVFKERHGNTSLTTRAATSIDPFYDEYDRMWLLMGKTQNPSDAINNMNVTINDKLLDQKYYMKVYLQKFETGTITKKQHEFVKENINLLDNDYKNDLLNTFPETFAPENNNSIPRPM